MQPAKNKKILFYLLFLGMFPIIVLAQKMDTSDLGHQITIRLARELSLSPSQQNEVDRASQTMANQVVTLLAQAKSTGNLDTAMARQIFKE